MISGTSLFWTTALASSSTLSFDLCKTNLFSHFSKYLGRGVRAFAYHISIEEQVVIGRKLLTKGIKFRLVT